MTDDELAAVAVALQAAMQTAQESPEQTASAWKRAARSEALDPFDKLRMTSSELRMTSSELRMTSSVQ